MNKSFPWLAVAAMALVVGASNFLVGIPINDWVTWGHFTYPLAFLINDLVNRFHGVATARRVVYAGFAVGVVMSLVIPEIETRIAVASGVAFLTSQLLDTTIFDKLRSMSWWIAPGVSSGISSLVDTALFYGIAFFGTGLTWPQWALTDLGVKWFVAALALLVYRLITTRANSARVAT